jgi:hypothetical protein
MEEEKLDVLDRMRLKTDRSQVPARKDSLLPDNGRPEPNQPLTSSQPSLDNLRRKVDEIPPTVRRAAVVLDERINEEIDNYCRRNRITLELFIEAVWVNLEKFPEVQADIVAEAQLRYKARKKAGGLRRTLALVMQSEKD